MKRIRDKERLLRLQRSRARKAAKRRVRRVVTRARSTSAPEVGADTYLGFDPQPLTLVNAPETLSIALNPAGCAQFFSEIDERFRQRRKVHVGLNSVKKIDYDAIVVLLSKLVRFKAEGLEFNGWDPVDPEPRRLLTESQFFEVLYGRQRVLNLDAYRFGLVVPDRGRQSMVTHAHRAVEPKLTADLIARATTTIWGGARRSQGVQRIFLELMQNTNNHASPSRQGEKHWWASVYHDQRERRVHFVFVDSGVGVFNSLDSKGKTSKWFEWRTKFVRVFSPAPNAEIMRLILLGQFHQTITGQPFRGKGLPALRDALDRGWVSNLLIVTNDVYADVARQQYRTISPGFEGTLVSWTMDERNLSSPE